MAPDLRPDLSAAAARRLPLWSAAALALALLTAPLVPAPVAANPFAPALIVNDRAITRYEIDQRTRFLTLLRAAPNPAAEAEKTLIEDRLRLQEANRLGLKASPEQVQAGMEEFASRANMSADQFIEALGQSGVEVQAFRDFVAAGVVWREVVRQKYAGKVQISEADVDKELARAPAAMTGARVLISELIIPAPPGQEDAVMARAQRLSSSLSGEAAFAAAARSSSAAQSRGQGGRLDWMEVENLPPQIRSVLLGLAPGQVSAPVAVPGAVALFLMRSLDEGRPVGDRAQTLDYAQLVVPGGPEEAARLRADALSCDNLYPIARRIGAGALTRQTLPQTQIPGDVALDLARLDDNESAITARGGQTVLLMLCARRAILPAAPPATAGAPGSDAAPAATPDRDAARAEVMNRRLTNFADRDLAKLRAEAIIIRP
ncbi:peptidylprolyl isomerase [Paracoccus sp. p4-l81]|uniref:peptidylprolyl isomerase n=1 Tax=Paracoccus sp. p4-l81 TaxID=3342806 RepID=UPI0035BAD0EF